MQLNLQYDKPRSEFQQRKTSEKDYGVHSSQVLTNKVDLLNC